jgi:hypothetical protein
MDASTREKLVALIHRMQCGEGDDEQSAEWVETLKRATGNPHASEFMSDRRFDGMRPEDILDRLLAYHPFLMPPPSA